MTKRRPTAYDRDIVDWLRAMRPGDWKIEVESIEKVSGFGLAEIKHEGSMTMNFEKTIIRIWPMPVRKAAIKD